MAARRPSVPSHRDRLWTHRLHRLDRNHDLAVVARFLENIGIVVRGSRRIAGLLRTQCNGRTTLSP